MKKPASRGGLLKKSLFHQATLHEGGRVKKKKETARGHTLKEVMQAVLPGGGEGLQGGGRKPYKEKEALFDWEKGIRFRARGPKSRKRERVNSETVISAKKKEKNTVRSGMKKGGGEG